MEDPLAHLLDGGLDLSRDGRYAFERELGRGSMGVVYAGRDLVLDRPVAIKVLSARVGDDAGLRGQFEREARAAARLAHRNVVAIHDFGCAARGTPFVVMERLRGRDLRKALRGRRPPPADRRLAIALQVLAGLAHAHARGVVHGDVKPANVFITDEGVVKILDFGIAQIIRAGGDGGSDAGTGTPDYMSPEQVLGGAVDGRSDLFSCGALLHELLTGRAPFHADGFVSTAYRVLNDQPDVGTLPAAFRALEPVLRRALAKSRDERYQSALDFATDIGLAMGVGVAPETIEPAPAWTVPLPRLTPVRPPDPAVTVRREWEESALRPPDLSLLRPRWPLRAAHDEDEAPPRRAGGRLARAALAVSAIAAAAAAFAAGMARVDPARAPVATAPAANVAPRVVRPHQPPPPSRAPLPVVKAPVAAAAPPAVRPAAARPATSTGGRGSFWTVVAPRPSAAASPQPTRTQATRTGQR